MPIANSGNQGGRMWPSEEWASRLFDWANVAIICSLAVGVVSTVLLVWMGNVKEAYGKITQQNFELELSKQQERTAGAEIEAAEAKKIAGGFEIAISAANQRAAEANAKAEGFRLDIARANERAANAEQRAADATLELARIKTPRSLTKTSELVASLESFEGTEYMFSFVFQDEDSTKLLRALDDVLQRAKWKRVKSQGRFPALEFWGKGGDAVTVGIGTGIAISVESRESLAALQARQINDLPEYIKAAVALNLSLASCLSPPQAPSDNKLVDVQPGDSSVVLIGVGKKP